MSSPPVQRSTVGTEEDVGRLDALRRSGMLGQRTFEHLDRLTELAASLTGSPVALISMVDEDRQYFTAGRGLGEPFASDRQTPLSHSVCRTVVESKSPVVIDALDDVAEFQEHPARQDMGVESYCGVPIHAPDGQVLGSFCVIDETRHEWDDTTIELLEWLAALVTDAIAINQDYTALIHDLQARVIPESLLTHPTGSLRGQYRNIRYSEAVGGDFYDALPRSDGGIDIVVGDVVGHGIDSTHAAAQLRAAARAVFTTQTTSPAEAIERIARSCADLPGCACAALLVAQVSPDGRTVSWARAGAMPPLLTGPSPRILDGGACPPLGVGPCEMDPDCQITLGPGEGLMLFTDGLIERRDADLDAGFARLIDALGEGGDLDGLIERSCPRGIQADDIAVVSWTPHR